MVQLISSCCGKMTGLMYEYSDGFTAFSCIYSSALTAVDLATRVASTL